jgi:hypothetical protein
MTKELETASREICRRLRQRPYNKSRAAKMSAWTAIIEQLLDGRRYGAFSWHKAVKSEVLGYIAELDEGTKRKIWEASEDFDVLPGANLQTITECLYPIIAQATMPRIHRAVDYRQKRGELQGEVYDD